MPCYEPAGHPQDYERIQHLTRLLCEAVSLIDATSLDTASPQLREWKQEHDRADAQGRARLESEALVKQAQQQAWDKLTPTERAALGIRYRP